MVNYIERAIKLAVENGYDGSWFLYPKNIGSENVQGRLFLDPDFWVALGKGLKWERKHNGCGGCMICPKYPECCMEGWKREWYFFISHLAAKKDPQLFFKDISTN